MSLADIHNRLPSSGDMVKKASNHLVKLVTGADAYRRHVWTLSPTSARNRHPKAQESQATWDTTDTVYFRWETQTFLPYKPGFGSIFLIDVQVEPLESLVNYAEAVLVNACWETMPPDIAEYKGLNNNRIGHLLRDVMDRTFLKGNQE